MSLFESAKSGNRRERSDLGEMGYVRYAGYGMFTWRQAKRFLKIHDLSAEKKI